MTNRTEIMIFVLVVLVLFSALFSSIETAFSSVNKIRLRNNANDGNREAEGCLKLLSDYDRSFQLF